MENNLQQKRLKSMFYMLFFNAECSVWMSTHHWRVLVLLFWFCQISAFVVCFKVTLEKFPGRQGKNLEETWRKNRQKSNWHRVNCFPTLYKKTLPTKIKPWVSAACPFIEGDWTTYHINDFVLHSSFFICIQIAILSNYAKYWFTILSVYSN